MSDLAAFQSVASPRGLFAHGEKILSYLGLTGTFKDSYCRKSVYVVWSSFPWRFSAIIQRFVFTSAVVWADLYEYVIQMSIKLLTRICCRLVADGHGLCCVASKLDMYYC